MRIWYVPYGELDNQRVLGQHNEIHALYSLVVRDGGRWGGLTREDELYFHFVHDETLVEFEHRQFEHHSPLPVTTDVRKPVQRTMDDLFLLELEDKIRRDRWDLICRWGGTYMGRIPLASLDPISRHQYEELQAQFIHQGGCLHNGGIESDTKLCLICKRYVRRDGEWIPR